MHPTSGKNAARSPFRAAVRARLVLLAVMFSIACTCFYYAMIDSESFPDDDEIEMLYGFDEVCRQKQTLTENVAAYLSGQVQPPPLLLENFTTQISMAEAGALALESLTTNYLCTTCDSVFNNSRLQSAITHAAGPGKTEIPMPPVNTNRSFQLQLPSVYAYIHPSFVHFVRLLGGGANTTFELDFIQYTAIRTAWKSLSPFLPDLIILLHSNIEPTGRYWSRLHEIDNVSLFWHHIALKPSIRGTQVRQFAHQADFRRLEILIQYGGIYMDFDVLLFNATQLLHERWNTECLLQTDSPSATTNLFYHYWKGWSYMINMGFMSCVKNSPFLHSWLQEYYDDFRPRYWLYNSGIVPTYLARAYRRRRPGALAVHQLSGNLMQDYVVSSSAATMTEEKFKEFLRNRFALHMYHIDYEDNTNGDSFKQRVRTSNSLLGYLYRYVWFGAEFVQPNTSSSNLLEFP